MADFRVDDYTGTDQQRLASANSAAIAAMPGSRVLLPNREITLTTHFTGRDGVHYVGEGASSSVFVDCVGTSTPTGSSQRGFVVLGNGTGGTVFEDFNIRARTVDYYRLIVVQNCSDVTLRNLTFGVCGQNFVEIRNCSDVEIHDCVGAYGGDNSYDGVSAKYKLSIIDSTDVDIHHVTLGRSADDHNQSFVTFNNVQRGIVRDSTFYGTKTYCLNTHGLGSRGVVFENNALTSTTATTYGAILIGNEAWGSDYDVVIRDNTMTGTGCFVEVRMDCVLYLGVNDAPNADPYLRTKLEDVTGPRILMGFRPVESISFW